MNSDVEDNDLEVIEDEPLGVNIEHSDTEANKNEDENDQDNEENDDEGQEKKVIKPKRIVKNPQPKLNAETLKSDRGLVAMPELFQKQKFKGRGHEEEDLRKLLKTYEYWSHRLFPKYPFEESVEKIERLGTKKPVITLIKRIRMGLMVEEPKAAEVSSDEEPEPQPPQPATAESRFDNLVRASAPSAQLSEEQIERIRLNKEKALKMRQDRLRRIQQQAESKLMASSQLPNIPQADTQSSEMEVDVFGSHEENLSTQSDHELSLTTIGNNLESCEDNEQTVSTHDSNEVSLRSFEHNSQTSNIEDLENTLGMQMDVEDSELSLTIQEKLDVEGSEKIVSTQDELSLTAIENYMQTSVEHSESTLAVNDGCKQIPINSEKDLDNVSNELSLTAFENDLQTSLEHTESTLSMKVNVDGKKPASYSGKNLDSNELSLTAIENNLQNSTEHPESTLEMNKVTKLPVDCD